MKYLVTSDCIACGLCESLCPEVFRLADRARAEVISDPAAPAEETAAEEAREGCPVGAIVRENA